MTSEYSINQLQLASREVTRFAVQKELPTEVEGADNLAKFHEMLKYLAGIGIINHLDRSDSFRAVEQITRHNTAMRVAFPLALKYAEGREGGFFQQGINIAQPMLGIDVWSVQQAMEADEASAVHPSHRQFFKNIISFLKIPGQFMVFAPEETRSQNGSLQKAQSGINNIIKSKQLKETDYAILPMAIHPQEGYDFDRNSFNRGVPFIISAGPPVLKSEILRLAEQSENEIQDDLMLRIAATLPPEMHGYYAHHFQE